MGELLTPSTKSNFLSVLIASKCLLSVLREALEYPAITIVNYLPIFVCSSSIRGVNTGT